jgi:hypothetical protein
MSVFHNWFCFIWGIGKHVLLSDGLVLFEMSGLCIDVCVSHVQSRHSI